MRRSSSSIPSRRRTAPKAQSSRRGGIWRRTRRLHNGHMVPDLAVGAATEIVGRLLGKPRSAIYAAFWLRWTASPAARGKKVVSVWPEYRSRGRNCGIDQALLFTYRAAPGAVRGADGGGSGQHTRIAEMCRPKH